MTSTYVGGTSAGTGNNASVAPSGSIAGIAVGDLAIVEAAIRNSGTGVPVQPAGWATIAASGNAALFGRFWQAGDALPTVAFTGGVANADTFARGHAFRGISPDQLAAATVSTQLNGSAQNIAYPALDVPADGQALLLFAWKQDDCTSIGTPAGWTSLYTTNMTAGDDQLTCAFYQIQTTETDIGSGSLTVTGGTSAISRAILIALKPAATLTVNVRDTYPTRTQIVLTGLTIGDTVDVYRVVAGQRTLVRASHVDAVIDTSYLVTDAELPFGVPVSYVAVVSGAEYTSSSTTYTLAGGKPALTDAITGAAAQVVVLNFGDQTYTRDSTRFRVGGRNIVVAGLPGQAEGSYDLYTETWSSFQNLLALLESSTEATVQIRQPGDSLLTGLPYEGVDAYLAIDSWTVKRFSDDGSDPRRITTVNFAQTDGWSDSLASRGTTYAEMADYYTGKTYADVTADFATYLDLAQAEFS